MARPVNAGKSPLNGKLDTTKVNYNSVPIEKLSHYKHSKDFQYIEKQPLLEGFWQTLFNKIVQIYRQLISGSGTKPLFYFLKIIFYFAVLLVFVLLILSLAGVDIQTIMIRNKKNVMTGDYAIETDIINLNFDKLAQTEIDNENYNLAVRYLYLKLLKVLTNKHLITWQRDKTNRDYILEMSITRYVDDFKIITFDYECVWYGKFQCSRSVQARGGSSCGWPPWRGPRSARSPRPGRRS